MGDGVEKERKRTALGRVAKVQGILRSWDPIGVLPGEVGPADEYDSYAPHIVSMMFQGCSREQLRAHLEAVRTEIGVEENREADLEIAGDIIEAIQDEAMGERSFLDSIDCKFPYSDRQAALHIAETACRISSNAAFAVLYEVALPPQNTTAPGSIRAEVVGYIVENLPHPLVKIVAPLAQNLVEGKSVSVRESVDTIRRIESYPMEFAALALACMSCDDRDGKVDAEYDRVRSEWEAV